MATKIILYDAGQAAFTSASVSESSSAVLTNQLLLNVLIELRVLTEYMARESHRPDDPQDLREDVVANGAYV